MIELIPLFYTQKIESIVEVGSADGDDSYFLAEKYSVSHENVHVIEPRPSAFSSIKDKYPLFQVYNIAIFNENKTDVVFYIDNYSGEISSLKQRQENVDEKKLYDESILVDVCTMDCFLERNNIETIDLVKIDVEGCTYEVIQGFKKYLKRVKVLHIECENIPFWQDQKLKQDVLSLLVDDFEIIFSTNLLQDDLILVNKQYLNGVCFSCIEDWKNNSIKSEDPI